MKRRDFIIAAATTPLLTQLQAFAKESQDTMGFVVFVVNVGRLPPHKAEAYIQRLKENLKKDEAKAGHRPAGWTFIFFPTREWDSNVEIYTVHPNADRTIEQIQEFICHSDGYNYESYLEEYNDHQVTKEALSVAETMNEEWDNDCYKLKEENERLKRENQQLKRRLGLVVRTTRRLFVEQPHA